MDNFCAAVRKSWCMYVKLLPVPIQRYVKPRPAVTKVGLLPVHACARRDVLGWTDQRLGLGLSCARWIPLACK